MNDIEAINRLKNGDIGGLEFLVHHYQRKAIQTAYLITHDEQLAEDAAQDAFVRFYQHIKKFDETRLFEPYLMRIVINCAISTGKKTVRWVQYGTEDDVEVLVDLFQQESSTEELVEQSRLKHEIENALEKLSPRHRAVIVQRYFLSMNEKEMAESLSVAPGTIKWLLNNARNHLRSLLGFERNAK
jgi:RNA polymerase sigma-70 factor (ECF subfamily)